MQGSDYSGVPWIHSFFQAKIKKLHQGFQKFTVGCFQKFVGNIVYTISLFILKVLDILSEFIINDSIVEDARNMFLLHFLFFSLLDSKLLLFVKIFKETIKPLHFKYVQCGFLWD